MQKIGGEREFGKGRHLRAEMVLRGVKVKDVANKLGWSTDKVYRALRDDRALTEDDHAQILHVIEGLAA